MTIVAHAYPLVIGVDTHAQSHSLTVLSCPHGEQIDSAQFPTTTAGIARAVDWVARRTGGDMRALWVIEGADSYGAQLARLVADTGYQAVEAPLMHAGANRGLGKSDPLDAHRIAAAVLPLQATALRHPRRDSGERAALQVLITARDHVSGDRTACVNALTALLRATDLGVDVRRPLSGRQVIQVARWRARRKTWPPRSPAPRRSAWPSGSSP